MTEVPATVPDIRERKRTNDELRAARDEVARLIRLADGAEPGRGWVLANLPVDVIRPLLAASEPLADGACARCLHGIGDHPSLSEWESACTACRCPAWVSMAHVVHLTDGDGECLPGCPTCLGIAWRAVEYAPPADADRRVLDQLVRDIGTVIKDEVAHIRHAGAASAAARRVLLDHAEHFVELAPAAADDTSCAMCGEEGDTDDPLRWCIAANGERLIAHGSCWAVPDVPPTLVAHLEAALSALRDAGGDPDPLVQAVVDAADKVVDDTPRDRDALATKVEAAILNTAPTWEQDFDGGSGQVCSVKDAALVAARVLGP